MPVAMRGSTMQCAPACVSATEKQIDATNRQIRRHEGPDVPAELISEFAWLIAEDADDPCIRYMIKLGLKSGFPPCCIAFHVKMFERVCPPDEDDEPELFDRWL